MNIFLLHLVPSEAARAHCDVHVNSQIRESCQMLSTAHRMVAGEPGRVYFERKNRGRVAETRPILPNFGEYSGMESTSAQIYWDCYRNHPCTRWVRESQGNYMFLIDLLNALHRQFRSRFGNKDHASWVKNIINLSVPPDGMPSLGITDFPMAMPEYCRGPDPVEAYRNYYRREKSHLYYQNGGGPMWFGYGRGVHPPDWLSSHITLIGKPNT